MTTVDLRSERDYAAWYDIFRHLDHLTYEVENVRARITQELGFERVHVNKLVPGDRMRTATGWHTVARVDFHDDDHCARVRGYPFYEVVWEGAEGTYQVEANSPDHPWAPLVTRAWNESEEAF